MTSLPSAIIHVFAIFAPLFSRPVYKNALQLFIGHILCKGRRTVADALRSLNLKNVKNFSKYHWFLSNAKWNCLAGAQILFLQIIKLISDDEIFINIDSTIERRKGVKIKGLGRQRDAARSSKSNKVLCIGLNWLVAAINLKLPFTKNPWALPFLSILMPPEKPLRSSQNKNDLNKKSRHKKMTEWACQISYLLRRWVGHSTKKITIVADSAFACFKLIYSCNKNKISLISRLRLDARLYDFTTNNNKQNCRRKRVVGKVLPKLSVLAKKDAKDWDEVKVKWYNGIDKKIFIQSGKCLWYYIGFPPVSLHWVLVKESINSEPIALFSTDLSHNPEQIIEAYVQRWREEVTFEEARRHLGMETQRQWSDAAINRSTPVILASFSIITLMGWELASSRYEKIPCQTSSWYKKQHVTFSDLLAYLREELLRKKYNSLLGKISEQSDSNIEDLIMQIAAA